MAVERSETPVVGIMGKVMGEEAAEALRIARGRPWHEAAHLLVGGIVVVAFLVAVVADFVIKYSEMAEESWFSSQTQSPPP
mmetsp:Transcript_36068/g.94843  ORF Transcript_36068/g.94843 Transcript_36068/m.94843 type:complete len:81 (-) Transcript_36068:348-590(-)